MLEELFNAIRETAVEAAGTKLAHKFLEVPGTNGRKRLLLTPDGEYQFFESRPAAQQVQIESVAEFVRYVVAHANVAEQLEEFVARSLPVVFYSEAGLFAWLVENERLDYAWMPLRKTPLLAKLIEIETKPFRGDQRETYNLLRIDFRKGLVDSGFYNWVRRCKWRGGGSTDRTVGVGNDSFGRTVDLAVACEDGSDCPESFQLRTKVFEDPVIADEVTIDMAVDIGLEEQKFTVKPFPGELRRVVDLELGAIAEYVRSELGKVGIGTFAGLPQVPAQPFSLRN